MDGTTNIYKHMIWYKTTAYGFSHVPVYIDYLSLFPSVPLRKMSGDYNRQMAASQFTMTIIIIGGI